MTDPVTNTPISQELQNRLFGILDYLGDLTKQGVDLAGQQIPLIAHDVVMYGAISGWIYVGIGLILMSIGIVFWIKSGGIDDDRGFILAVIGTLFLFLGGVVFCVNLNGAIKATFAPRVYLIEWVADQVKQLR